MTPPGRFITFEGIDGAGKSTQVDTLVSHLTERGLSVTRTREPGGTPFAEALRQLVLRESMSARAETLAVFAARSDHLSAVVEPALAAGRWVVCDRFTDATYAYQCGGRGVPAADVAQLERWVHPDRQPDLTFLIDADPALAAARLAASRTADRFETESLAFFARVRAVYLQRAGEQPTRFCTLDGSHSPDAIAAQIRARIDRLLAEALT